jgi:type III secretory pathway component EscT
MPSLVGAVADGLARSGVDLEALGLAWARAMPAVVLVPGFGLRALPPPARFVMGLAFAATTLPALAPLAPTAVGPWPVALLIEGARGVPVALGAAVPLWAATMAGGLADSLRGWKETASAPTVEEPTTPLGVLFSLLASGIFLSTGGPARVVLALTLHPAVSPLRAAAHDISGGIVLAVALAGPLLAAALVIEIGAALISRAASPAQVHALLAPLRALGMLAVMALVFERLAAALARAVESAP